MANQTAVHARVVAAVPNTGIILLSTSSTDNQTAVVARRPRREVHRQSYKFAEKKRCSKFGYLVIAVGSGSLLLAFHSIFRFAKYASAKFNSRVSNYEERGDLQCVLAPYPAGWGNAVHLILYGILKNTPEDNSRPFPCVQGYGEVFGQLFQNVAPCLPDEHPIETCQQLDANVHPPWKQIFKRVKTTWNKQLHTSNLLELNSTFVKEILAQSDLTLTDVQSSCAVHARFGDYFFRELTEKWDSFYRGFYKGEFPRNLCKKSYMDESKCFREVADLIRRKCPDPKVPVYLATDLPKFFSYFVSQEPTRTVLLANEANATSTMTHIDDIKELSIAAKEMHTILRDWIVLAIAKQSRYVSRSTFSSSARLGFFISPDEAMIANSAPRLSSSLRATSLTES
jgi:hypothetical protein